MKCITLIFLFLIHFSGQSQFTLKKNTVLNYQVVDDDGTKHTFDITIDKFGNTGIKFNWQMIFGENKSNGIVTIYKAALETAVTYRNYFANKSNIKLTKESTVWLSKKNYSELVAKKESELSLDFNLQKFKWTKDIQYTANILGKTKSLPAFEVKSTTTENYLSILKNEANPLILKMKPKDFTIYLVSVVQK